MPRSRRFAPVPSDPADPAAPPTGAAPEEHSLSHFEVPAETTPTWELEMLVSGAVLFGLLQLPPIVSDALTRFAPRLGEKAFLVAFESYLFVKAILYALIAGFLLHLASRAYWVALVGLDSVFPRGIRWERATAGPVTRDYLRSRFVSLPVRIERIDNFASVIFAAAFGIVFILLGGLGLVGVLAGLTWLVSHALLHDRAFVPIFFALLGLLMLAPLIGYVVDRRMGERLSPDGRAARIIRGIAAFQYRFQGVAIHGPITQTLFTNVRKSVAWPAMMLMIVGSIGAGMTDLLVSRNVLRLDGSSLLPRSGAGVVDSRYYADQRSGDDRYSAAPSIQSDMVRDPYVRLFVPFIPARDESGILHGCPVSRRLQGGSPGTSADVALNSALLACLGRMRAVALDGRALDPGYRFFTDPQSGLRGLLGYLAVDGMVKGPHVLVVQPAALAPDATRRDTLAARPDSIPFRL